MRIRSVLVAAAGATSLLVALGPGAQAVEAPAVPAPAARATPAAATAAFEAPAALLDRPLRGAAAVAAVRSQLAEVAAVNDTSAAEVASRLTEDRTTWLGRSGLLHAKDDSLPAPEAPVVAARAPFPSSKTFALHSKPGSSRVLHLDFDGHLLAGTAWNTDYGLPEARQPAFSLDASRSAWSQAEHDLVQSVFLRVAEDFVPFDVDVTTQEPGAAALTRSSATDAAYGMRVLITPARGSQELLCPAPEGCGGVAHIGTFDDVGNTQHGPAWVFSHQLSNDPKDIAEAVSHEAGHTLGLEHHGTAASDYYQGHNGWAPIMGVGYDQPLVQWSRGEFRGATNRQDDLAVMQRSGLRLRGDDHGSTPATARRLGTALTASGVLETRTDKDVFALTRSCTGPLGVQVAPPGVSPDADLRVRLLSAGGAVLDQDDPRFARKGRDTAAGLSAAVSAPTTPGTYYVEVDGVGAGTLATGSSDYASIGTYTVRVQGCPAASTRTLTLTSVADTQARQAAPALAAGAATALASDGQERTGTASRTTSYVGFTVPALAAGESVSAAALSLQVTGPTADGPLVWRTAPTWSEAALSWRSGSPARSGTAAVGDFGAMAVGRVHTPVSGVTGGGAVSFQLHAEGGDAVVFASREHPTATSRPRLVLTIARR